jgi:type VI secretion system protein
VALPLGGFVLCGSIAHKRLRCHAMAGFPLLKRLEANADPTAAGRTRYRTDDLEAAVRDHLHQLLNTRQGSAPTVPDYGVIEFTELLHDFPHAISILQRNIKNTILKYEPRLKNVQVRAVEADDDLDQSLVYFEVSAQLVHPDGERQPIRFSTSVDESSNVTLG